MSAAKEKQIAEKNGEKIENPDPKQDPAIIIETYVDSIENQLQYALKMLAKLCLTKATNKCDNDSKKSDKYKSLYSLTLRNNSKDKFERFCELYSILVDISTCNIQLTISES